MSRNFSLLGRDDMRRRSKFRQLIGILMVLLFIIAPNDCIRASDKIKVAFYEYYPYYYLNEQLQPSGYYHDLMNLIANDLNLDYGDSITAECEVFTYEIFPAEITILSVSAD